MLPGTLRDDAPALVTHALILRAEGALQEAEALLREAAATGHLEAVAQLGLQLYLSPPPTPDSVLSEGWSLILRAAKANHATAAHMAALIAVHDFHNWPHALDHAAHAAACGYIPAQFALAFLSNDVNTLAALARGEKPGPGIWPILRTRIDLSWLLAPPRSVRTLSASPHIVLAEGFVPPAFCDWIIRRGKNAVKKGKGYVPEGAGYILRTNSEVQYGLHELDLVHMAVRQRIANATALPLTGLEPCSVFRYATGEQFTAHHDYLDPDIPDHASEISRTGQCVTTVLIYLNEDFDGGETHFIDLGLKAKGRKGDALIFRNVDETGAPEIRTRHAGLPPTCGEKWLFSQFIRDTKQANKIPG